MVSNDRIDAGQAVYTPLTLWLYDWFVLGFSNSMLWRCPSAQLRAMYDRNVSSNHLDIGVGTGYFLDHAQWPVEKPDIMLVDLNSHSLAAASSRIARYAPRTLNTDVFKPLPFERAFDSVGVCYLLHCLPGDMIQKCAIFDNIVPAMREGARVFGATILQGDAPRSRPAQWLMSFYNRKGVFSNAADTIADLGDELESRFSNVSITRHGAVAIFEARVAHAS